MPSFVSGTKFFGFTDRAEPDPWSEDRDPWTVVQRKKGVNSAAPTGSASTFPTAPSATPSPSLSCSPTAIGPIFPPLFSSAAIPSISSSGVTSFTSIKDAPTTINTNEAEIKVEVSVPPFVPPPADVDGLVDSLPIASES